ncbi:MAG: hypothetical protein Q4F02_03510 [Candidatus Saccharibacteria bacterium]|nr:hypothetical protein [Candidatus Saccharibacteria bacterium]
MRTIFRCASALINLMMAMVAIITTSLIVSQRGIVWEAWLLAALAVLNTVALSLTATAATEGKEEKS